jgi:hypothetical protein
MLVELRRGTRKRETDKLTQYLAAEKADNDGNPFIDAPKRSRAKANRVRTVPESVSDQEDDDFELPDLIDPSDSERSDDEMDVDNDEVRIKFYFLEHDWNHDRLLLFFRLRRCPLAPSPARLRPVQPLESASIPLTPPAPQPPRRLIVALQMRRSRMRTHLQS